MVAVYLLAYISVNLFLQSQGQKIQQAKIFSENKEVPEGGKLEVTCSAFGFTAKAVYFYLCKDGKAVDMKNVPTQKDTVFKLERSEMNHSGNYSCMVSEEPMEITKVKGYGHNYIYINVIESLINTQIHLLKSEVPVGSDAEFICEASSSLNETQSKNMILAYLIKNEKPVKVNIWDSEEMKTKFTLKEVRMEDAGKYSCAVLLNILPFHGMRLDRNNKVNLQITVASGSGTGVIVTVVIICIVLLLSLFLGIWAMIRKRGFLVFSKDRSLKNQTELGRTDVFYEEINKPDTGGTGEIRSVVCAVSAWQEFSGQDDPVPYNM